MSDILVDYAKTRREKAHDLTLRERKAYALCPRLEDIERELREASANMIFAVARRENPKAACDEAEQKREMLLSERKHLLEEQGLPEDYLELGYACDACKDTGFVQKNGAKSPCTCLVRKRLMMARATSGVQEDERFENSDSSVFRDEKQLAQMHKAQEICMKYAQECPNPAHLNLVLMGAPGLGKTYLVNCIANRVLELGECLSVKKVTAYNLVQGILTSIKGGDTDVAAPYVNAELLLIDDLGTEPMMNNITIEYLFSILNERQSAKKATVIATNLTLGDIQERYGERFFSRMIDSKSAAVIRLAGSNLRLRR